MRIILAAIFLNVSFLVLAQTDSTKNAWQVNGVILLTNNGISPVPAFSLGKPALMATLFVKKRGFIFSPEFNFGSDGKPWTVNQWFRYQFSHEKFSYRAGINFTLYFGRETVQMGNTSVEVAKLNQYTALEANVGYQLSAKSSLNLTYWNSHGLDFGSVKSGHFLSFSASFSKIPLSKLLFLELRPNVFYINNKVPFEGLFVSSILNISFKKFPVSLFTQGVQPIWSLPSTKFSWNYGLNYIF